MEAAEEALEKRRLPLENIDEEDATLGRVAAALERDERGDRMGRVGQEDVLVRREDHQRQHGGEQDEAGGDEPAGGQQALHRSDRPAPPSTRTVVPFTYEARSEARKQTTSPNSRGLPSRPSGIWAISSAGGPSVP